MRKLVIVTLIFLGVSSSVLANEQSEKIYLVQIINQLNAIQPMIVAAEKEQPKNKRIRFHYTKYRDYTGKIHNGLLEDIQAIKEGINQKLNETSTEPRTIAPIKGDYLNAAHGESK